MAQNEPLSLRRYLSRSEAIARRYFVVNGFDGALTMLGMLTGFYLGGDVDTGIVIRACAGAAVALGVSGFSSAYLSESAERRHALSELEHAMMTELSDTAQGRAVRFVSGFVALANGLAPVLLAVIIITPLWLAHTGVPLPLAPLPAAIATALFVIFLLGVLIGRIGGITWWQSGLKTAAIALITLVLIILLGGRV
mgnify:CR=1 FL=1